MLGFNSHIPPESIIIPIKVDSYESLFNELHYAVLNKRKINESLDDLLKSMLFQINNSKKSQLILEVTLPKEAKSLEKEKLSTDGILNNYKAFAVYEKKVRAVGLRRIIYYILSALLLLSSWFLISNRIGESLITALLSSGGTVLLWQSMTLILIENKNLQVNVLLNKKLANMKINYIYN